MNNKGYLTAKTTPASDEYYTPEEAVIPLLKYLKFNKYKSIWCPFDTEDSEFVKIFKKEGYNVIFTHINNGQDFFTYEPLKEDYDVIISNPPFSKKDEVLKRLSELHKDYAILMPLPSLQGQKRFPYLKTCQALIFNKRINFWKDKEHTIRDKGVAFASIYICKHFLPSDLIFEEI